MIDMAEFQCRLAGGELDDVVRRLLGEMDVVADEPEESDITLSSEMDRALERSRLLRQSTLLRLIHDDFAASKIGSAGRQQLRIQYSSAAESTAAEVTLMQDDDGTAYLSGSFPEGVQPLEIVAVLPHIARNSFLRPVMRDSPTVLPRDDFPKPGSRVPATTILSTSKPLGDGARETQPVPSFDVIWNSADEGVRISTPARPTDGEELLVLVTLEKNTMVPVILERPDGNDQQLTGYCPLPTDVRDGTRIRVKVNSIDLVKLSELPPQFVSLWLATRPMIAIPLSPINDRYVFTMDESDQEFLKLHPDAVVAVRVALSEKGGAQ